MICYKFWLFKWSLVNCSSDKPKFVEPLQTDHKLKKLTKINFLQEFGEGARARRLYENNSEEEEEKEVVILKENPKLQQGSITFMKNVISKLSNQFS